MTYCLEDRIVLIVVGCICLVSQALSQCQILSLTPAKTYKRLIGSYHLHCIKDDGSPVYQHKYQGVFIYRANGSKYWTVGPLVGGHVEYLRLAADGAKSPENIEAVWQAWSETRAEWINDAAKLECIDCKTIMFNGSGIPEAVRGKYLSQNIIHNLRLIYKHQSNTLYLHYTSCHKWIVGPKIGQNMGAMFVESNATSPRDVSEMWTVFLASTDIQTDDVHATCLDERPNVFKPSSMHECGMNSLDDDAPVSYLLMGTEVRKGKYPWMVSVRRPDGVHRCGGVLIGTRWVLTAGHCTQGTGSSEDTVIVGAHNLDLPQEAQRQSYKVKQSFQHPNFTWSHQPLKADKDLGVLELQDDVVYNDYVQPVCLPDSPAMQFVDSADICYLTGWGEIDTRSKVGGVLRELKGRVKEPSRCGNILLQLFPWLPESSSLCIQPNNDGKICIGDSGGPLLCSRRGRWYAVGIASWVMVACISTNLPSVFSDITQDIDWIRTVCDC